MAKEPKVLAKETKKSQLPKSTATIRNEKGSVAERPDEYSAEKHNPVGVEELKDAGEEYINELR